ncbi:flagellar hook-length control protein FliK [Paenibacillus yanchengensis]|uniref:Flagellar hook-length control protein FliK n=1 Tax=Paenibacillus yanchengensis TaxID=2035833 RepID=A0ABW4YM58_9BACL
MNLAPFAILNNASAAGATNHSASIVSSEGNSAVNPIFGRVLFTQLNDSSSENVAKDSIPSVGIPLTASLSSIVNPEQSEIWSDEELLNMLESLLTEIDQWLENPDLSVIDVELLEQIMNNMQAIFHFMQLDTEPVTLPSELSLSTVVKEGEMQQATTKQLFQQLQQMLLQLQTSMEQPTQIKMYGQHDEQYLQSQLMNNLSKLDQLVSLSDKSKLSDQQLKVEVPTWLLKDSNSSGSAVEHLHKLTTVNATMFKTGETTEQVTTLATLTSDTVAEAAPLPSVPISQLQLGSRLTSLVTTSSTASTFVVADEFADTMSDMIVQRFTITTLNGMSEAKLQLYPEQLGQVDVKLMMQNGQLTALFRTDNIAARDLLDGQMAQLRAALQAQGLQVEKMVVSYEQANPATDFNQQHHQQQQQHKQKHLLHDLEEQLMPINFEAELLQQTIIQQLGMGRAINTSV